MSLFKFETQSDRVFCAWFEVEFLRDICLLKDLLVEVVGVALRFDELWGN